MISVVIPVYNAENYLRTCIESVQKQTYQDWELYLVDDGSIDTSGLICDQYADKDKRIHVIHQKNKGAGTARNEGIKKVSGKYIVFLDADDYIAPNYFELLSAHDEDVVFIDVQLVDIKGKVLRKELMSLYSTLSKNDIIRRQMTGAIAWGGVYKAVKTNLIKDNGIKYTSHKVGEEALLSFQILHDATTWGFLERCVYNYVDHNESLSHTKMDDHWGPVALALRDYIKKIGEYDTYANTLNAFIQTAAAVRADKVVRNHPLKEVFSRLKETREWMIKQCDFSYSVDTQYMGTKARLMAFFLKYRFYTIIYVLSKVKMQISR